MSKIEWTHRPGTTSKVWNMIRGCSLESRGCEQCYAMKFAHRFSQPGGPFEGLTRNTNSGIKWTGKIKLMPEMLTLPLKWKKPFTCFVNSMTDLFHPDVPFDFIDNVFAVMDACPHGTFIILTKRAERMYDYFQERREWRVGQLKYAYNSSDPDLSQWPLKNVWMMVSAEDQKTFDERVKWLMQIPAAIRGVSIEPQIGPINMYSRFESNEFNNFWVIQGGESGQQARPYHPDWFRIIREQCKYAGIPYFFKQFGKWGTKYQSMTTGEPVFKMYLSYLHFTQKDWVNKGDVCVDADGKICKIGKDFETAKYPVVILSPVGKSKSGNHLDGEQHLNFPA